MMKMTFEQIDEVLEAVSNCIARMDLGECSDDCESCDLRMPTRDKLTALSDLRVIMHQFVEEMPNEELDFDYEEIFDKWGISKRPGTS